MATKKTKKKVEEPAAAEEPAAVGPSETTVDKGADEAPEGTWRCPHCSTWYRADAVVARRNHLQRVHGESGG